MYPTNEYVAAYHAPVPGNYYTDPPENIYYTPEQQIAAQQYYQHHTVANQELYYNQGRHHGDGNVSQFLLTLFKTKFITQ